MAGDSVDVGRSLPDEFRELNRFASTWIIGGHPAFTGNVEETVRLPVVHLFTDCGNEIESRREYVAGEVSIEVPSGSGFATDSGFTGESLRVRGRGNSTWNVPDKKSYRLNFDNKVEFLGLPEGRHFVLLANAFDRSHIRNSIAFATARSIDTFGYVPTAIHVDLYFNGEYQGLYTIGTFIRPNMDGMGVDPVNGVMMELNGTNSDIHERNIDFFHSEIIKHLRFRNPEPPLDEELFNDIRSYFREADLAVLALEGYEDYIDMVSVIDYFLFTELLYNLDGAFVRSVFVARNPGGRLFIPSVWDFDLSMGNYRAARSRYNYWASIHDGENTAFRRASWINYLIECPAFQYAVRVRWERNADLMMNAAFAEIARNRAFLEPAVIRDNYAAPFGEQRFTTTRSDNIPTWNGHLDFIETFLTLRRGWMDETISEFPAEPPGGRDILAGATGNGERP
jgi:hypothetical protein